MPEIDVIVEWESLSDELDNMMNSVSNVSSMLSRSVKIAFGAAIQLQATSLGLVRAYRAQRDAKREMNRWKSRHYELDIQQAELNVKLAERQKMAISQGGTRLDILQASLNEKKAIRDLQVSQFDIDNKGRKLEESELDAEMSAKLMDAQSKMMFVQLVAEIVMLTGTILAIVATKWAAIWAKLAAMSAATVGIYAAIGGAIIAASIALVWSLTPSMPEFKGGQTEVGQTRRIDQGGIMEVHSGEYIGRNDFNKEYVINLNTPNVPARDFMGLEGMFEEMISNA